MRQTWRFRVGLAMLLLANGLRADPAQHLATVTVPEAEVRSGAGNTPQMYVTNRLRKDDKVEVVKEMDGGWLAIKPPAGSISWINARNVKPTGPGLLTVVSDNPDAKVPVLVGHVNMEKPTVEGAKVKPGTILTATGQRKEPDDGVWLGVYPPVGEVRYIRAESVSRKTDSPAPSGGHPEGPPGVAAFPVAPIPGNPAAAAPAAPEQGANALWLHAQQLEQAGMYREAIQLYRQLGAEAANTNQNLSVQAYSRADYLAGLTQGKPGPPQGSEARYPTMTTSRQVSPSNPPAVQPGPAPAGWDNSGPGWLRRAGRCIDYSPLYVLENSQGLPILYAMAQQGYSLDRYVNQNVELLGVLQFRNDQNFRAKVITVGQVRLLP